MRGSPLIRTFLVLAALVVSGIGFARLTQKGVAVSGQHGVEIAETSESDLIPAKVYVTFSRLVGMHDLRVGEKNVALTLSENGELNGSVSIDLKNPVVFLRLSCIPPLAKGEPRMFAKLVVEAEGKETFTHVFDADGDIDDFVELPF